MKTEFKKTNTGINIEVNKCKNLTCKVSSGLEIKECYQPEKNTADDYIDSLGFSGEYPFTRGIHPTMYRGRLWTMRQYSGYGTAEETNKRYQYLLQHGQTGLSVAFDLPTQMGYDSDDPLSRGEVGKTGVAISSLADMETLFDGIPLDKVSVSMTINATCPVILAMYLALAEKRGIDWQNLNGTVQNDILKEYFARGAYIFPPEPSLRLVIDTIEYCIKNIPRWNYISVSGYHIRESGSTAAQEIGFTLADGIAYLDAALKRGLDVNELGRRISFFLNAHNDFLEEIAKFRAARRLWAKIMKERFRATDPRAMMFRFHTQTAGCTLTAQQPDNNVTRVAFQSLAAVLGGTQSLHTNSRDEALSLPTEKSVKIALRTQQLAAYETSVTETVDPFSGSFYLEHLTDQLEKMAEDYIKKIDEQGGAVQSIENGYYQSEISKSAYEYQQAIETKKRIVVGVNEFQDDDEKNKKKLKILKVKPSLQNRQINNLRRFKKGRDSKKVNRGLEILKEAARTGPNLMPVILECVKAQATLGEICRVLREVFGEYRGQSTF